MRPSRKLIILAAAILVGGAAVLVCAPFFLTVPLPEHPDDIHRPICKGQLYNIKWALRCYYDDYGQFPPARFSIGPGKPEHSWRVLLLPYLEAAQYYKMYAFEESPYSPNNRRVSHLVAKEGPFHCPAALAAKVNKLYEETNYMLLLPEAQNRARPKSKDGQEPSVLIVVEVYGTGVPWNAPADLYVGPNGLVIDPDSPKSVRSAHVGGVFALHSDGRPTFLTEDVCAKTLMRWLMGRDGRSRPRK